MTSARDPSESRRRFMQFLAGSPLLVAAGIDRDALRRLLTGTTRDQSAGLELVQQATQEPALIKSASEAISAALHRKGILNIASSSVAGRKAPRLSWRPGRGNIPLYHMAPVGPMALCRSIDPGARA